MYISPRRLAPGNKVAIIAPSSPFKTDEVREGLDTISSMGLVPVLGPNVRELHAETIHAAPLESRVKELMWAFTDPNISGIICATGGFGCAALLPHLDYGTIARSKKVFITISDGTALNNGILSGAGLVNFNAQTPSIRLDEGARIYRADVESLVHVLKMCMSLEEWGSSPFDINDQIPRTISHGRAEGIAVGGNLDTFTTLIGTNFLPETQNSILFIEDVHKGSVKIARMLLHLKLSGILDKISGIVVGEFADVPTKKDDRDPSIEDALQEYLKLNVPVLYGFSFSHGPHTCPIPIGAMTYLDATNRTVEFDFAMGR